MHSKELMKIALVGTIFLTLLFIGIKKNIKPKIQTGYEERAGTLMNRRGEN